MEQQTPQIEVKPVNKAKVKGFIKVMLILAAVTALEFAIAFMVPAAEFKWTRIIAFILLTIVKAYYIVGEFMHLGHERKALRLSIVLPMILVCFLIFILIVQGDALLKALY